MLSSVWRNLYQLWYKRYRRWINRRIKPARKHRLNNRRLFIFPSRSGFGFLFLVILLWLLGTNYENNLVLAFAFFLTSMMIIVIHHTFFNMLGMEVEFLRAHPCFFGEDAEIDVRIDKGRKSPRESLTVGFENSLSTTFDLLESDAEQLKLFFTPRQRGRSRLPRLRVESVFPLGLIRCWTWLGLDADVLVYPKPLKGYERPSSGESDGQEGELLIESGNEDFVDLKRYQTGDSMSRVAWKPYARGRGLYTKEFGTFSSEDIWLEWDALDGFDLEVRLSVLCDWVLKLSGENTPYGLRLPGIDIEPDIGSEHRLIILEQLALFKAREREEW